MHEFEYESVNNLTNFDCDSRPGVLEQEHDQPLIQKRENGNEALQHAVGLHTLHLEAHSSILIKLKLLGESTTEFKARLPQICWTTRLSRNHKLGTPFDVDISGKLGLETALLLG